MTERNRLAQTPTRTIVSTQVITGAMLLVFAFLNAANVRGERQVLLTVALGAVGGVLVGLGLGMARHRRAAQRAE